MLTELPVLAEEFSSLPDTFSQYTYLIELAALLPEADASLHQEKYRHKGCQSDVWLKPEVCQGTVRLRADSSTLVIRGVLYLFSVLLDGESPEAVMHAQFDLLTELGIREHFNSQRTLGISGILPAIRSQLSETAS